MCLVNQNTQVVCDECTFLQLADVFSESNSIERGCRINMQL